MVEAGNNKITLRKKRWGWGGEPRESEGRTRNTDGTKEVLPKTTLTLRKSVQNFVG